MYPGYGKTLIVQGEIPTNDTIGSHPCVIFNNACKDDTGMRSYCVI